MYRLYRKMTIHGHFSIKFIHFYLDIIGCLTNTVYALDPNNLFLTRLWCTYKSSSKVGIM